MRHLRISLAAGTQNKRAFVRPDPTAEGRAGARPRDPRATRIGYRDPCDGCSPSAVADTVSSRCGCPPAGANAPRRPRPSKDIFRALSDSGLWLTMKTGAPDRIRTCGLCLRRAALYPAELRVHNFGTSTSSRQALQLQILSVRPAPCATTSCQFRKGRPSVPVHGTIARTTSHPAGSAALTKVRTKPVSAVCAPWPELSRPGSSRLP